MTQSSTPALQIPQSPIRGLIAPWLFPILILTMAVIFFFSQTSTFNPNLMPKLMNQPQQICSGNSLSASTEPQVSLCNVTVALQKALNSNSNLLLLVGLFAFLFSALFVWLGDLPYWVRIGVFIITLFLVLYPLGTVA